ncbi:hypothetical protein E3P92_01608 [Wallemia ichthyophaga]|uniref:Cyclin-like domain-containing protein n=2 Tax=Wallemia ichthyophaga TaxID=245174 RepID=A0A4T0H9A7_WALIC|nr:Cyclin pch1 [Wallemia ichthyophaga EXF-994]TIA91742.1 hypothetical protein E3P97_01902 [Wallemia ichthyophaga]EOR00123.1 Cyclin pch1 [Wallemia ichthyophaga EXF-994]TIB12049.1 hypothetical protein E3P90_02133 [Wallemia ichthyophaga]TIB13343.1 hypothetical protein E3P93_01970 [Wallemia ichthyophaga]TIB15537.1 hypothetical protein E3P92_01608 [Wallemia ichthyophaga]
MARRDQWIFSDEEVLHTPSVAAGLSASDELRDRIRGVNWLLRIGVTARVRSDSLYNACLYFHRFYMRKSLQQHDVEQTALTCLFLACKAQDAMKHVTQLAALAVFKHRSDTAKAQGRAMRDKEPMHIKDEPDVVRLQENMLSCEITLLRTLTFDLAVRQPFPLIVDAARSLQLKRFDVVMMHAVLNDSMRSNIALSYPPLVVALVAFTLPSAVADEAYLSGTYRDINWQDQRWLGAFGVDVSADVSDGHDNGDQALQPGKRSRSVSGDGDATANNSKRMKGESGSGHTNVHSSQEVKADYTDRPNDANNNAPSHTPTHTHAHHLLMDTRDAIIRFAMIFRYLDRDVRARQQANKGRIAALLSCFPKRHDSVWAEDEILGSF